MNILTIQHDGKLPNLALLKIRAYHRQRGDIINGEGEPDRVYISCIFPKNRPTALGVAKKFPHSEVYVGGSGVNYDELPKEIEDTQVIWEDEDMDYAMGFTSRGCIRNCPFCIVPAKEGNIREHHSIEHIANGMKKIVLLDNNLLALPSCIKKLEMLKDNNYKVNFNQGLDIRLITPQIASVLADIHYFDVDFRSNRIYFAWDMIAEEKDVRKGLEILLAAGIKPYSLMIYMLCGFNTTIEKDYYRFNVLKHEYDVIPYVQVYDNLKDLTEVRAFARWVNRRLYKSCSWEDYERRPKEEKKVDRGRFF